MVCPPIGPSVGPSVGPSFGPSVGPSVCPSVRSSVTHFFSNARKRVFPTIETARDCVGWKEVIGRVEGDREGGDEGGGDKGGGEWEDNEGDASEGRVSRLVFIVFAPRRRHVINLRSHEVEWTRAKFSMNRNEIHWLSLNVRDFIDFKSGGVKVPYPFYR